MGNRDKLDKNGWWIRGQCPFRWPGRAVYEYQCQRLRTLGETDRWIAQNVHSWWDAAEAIDWLVCERYGEDAATWLYVEVPESHVYQPMVIEAKKRLRLVQRLLRLPPITIRWLEEYGVHDPTTFEYFIEVSMRSGCRAWNCDMSTMLTKHLEHRELPTQCDSESGEIYKLTGDVVGWTHPDEPTSLVLRSERCLFAQKEDMAICKASDAHRYDVNWPEDIPEITVSNAVAQEARYLWQYRHFREEILADAELLGQDAWAFANLMISRDADKREAGRKSFDTFVAQYVPFASASDENEPE